MGIFVGIIENAFGIKKTSTEFKVSFRQLEQVKWFVWPNAN